MKITLAFSHMGEGPDIRSYFEEKAGRLNKHVKRFKPDLVFLHGSMDKNPHKEEFYASLTLYMPTTTLHCREAGGDSLTAINKAFLCLIRQAERHADKIGREKRRRER